jgi:hypothetical protein
LLGAHRGAAQDLGPIGQLPLKPLRHARGLAFTAMREWALGVGQTLFNRNGFGMTPQDQVHVHIHLALHPLDFASFI